MTNDKPTTADQHNALNHVMGNTTGWENARIVEIDPRDDKLNWYCGQHEILTVKLMERDEVIRVTREALNFYADKNTYIDLDNSCSDPDCCTPFPYYKYEHEDNCGDKARAAIALADKIMEGK